MFATGILRAVSVFEADWLGRRDSAWKKESCNGRGGLVLWGSEKVSRLLLCTRLLDEYISISINMGVVFRFFA